MHRVFSRFLILVTVFISSLTWAAIEPMDKIVAIVNEGIITQSQLDNEFKEVKTQLLATRSNLPADKDLKKQVLDRLILAEIQYQFAERTGILIDDQTLDNMIAQIAKRNQMDVTQLRQALREEGVDYALFRDTVKRQNTITQLQQRDVVNEVEISDAEVNQFLNSAEGQSLQGYQYHISHILIALPEAPTPEDLQKAQAKAKDILNQIDQGADFSVTALSQSSGSQALSGGDLGWRSLAAVPSMFIDDVTRMEKGDVVGPIRSPSGFHIVKLNDKKMNEQQESTIAKTQVRHILIKPNALLSDIEAQLRLEDLVRDIKQGTDFAVLAKTHSEDLASSNQGGSLGWVTPEQLVEEFSDVMDKTTIGEISEPFKSPFGWHILQVLDRKTENNLDEVLRLNAQAMLRQRKVEEKLENWLRQMRDEAFVQVLLTDHQNG